ncbi:MAG: hypothetical protein ACYTF6_06850, partial [Planctomycetota bacterium]
EKNLGRFKGELAKDKNTLDEAYTKYLALLKKIDTDPQFAFAKEIADAEEKADGHFRMASGEPLRLVARATAERWQEELKERARAEAFDQQLRAFRVNPRAYVADLLQEFWDEVLSDSKAMKYVVAIERDKVQYLFDSAAQSGGLRWLVAGGEEPTGE